MEYKEIGGYIEFERSHGTIFHEKAVALNCGRNCLAYLIRAKNIKKIALPYFLCNSVPNVCKKEKVSVRFYKINTNFHPENLSLNDDEWFYVVNYYGQLNNKYICHLAEKYGNRVIVDNAQAYFQAPAYGIDTLYTCRKFFGVPDGAFLYTDILLNENLCTDFSYDRMRFLLGRFERPASDFYSEYTANNHIFADEPIKKMSKLTKNLLGGIDYEFVKKRRTENFGFLDKTFADLNKLKLKTPEGAFMYPLYIENGAEIKSKLQKRKIYIPSLWPSVFDLCEKETIEFNFAKNILPLPVDQRYNIKDMDYISHEVIKCIN